MGIETKDPFGGNYRLLYYYVKDNESLFGLGLPLENRRTLDIEDHQFTMATVGVKFEEFLEAVTLLPARTRYVAILKIPVHYLGKVENGSYYPLVPMIDSYFDFMFAERNYVTSNLVLGVYDTLSKQYTPHEGYNLWFDPAGFQYSDEQIAFLSRVGANDIVVQANARWLKPRQTLREEDEANGLFLPVTRYYQGQRISSAPHSRYRAPKFGGIGSTNN